MAVQVVSFVNTFGSLSESIAQKVDEAIRDTASDLVPAIQAMAPVDTSALRESVNAVTDQWSTYELAVSEAKAVMPDVVLHEKVEPDGPHEAVVSVAAGHGIFNEYGTVSMGARPFFTPAIEAARQPFHKKIAEAISSG